MGLANTSNQTWDKANPEFYPRDYYPYLMYIYALAISSKYLLIDGKKRNGMEHWVT